MLKNINCRIDIFNISYIICQSLIAISIKMFYKKNPNNSKLLIYGRHPVVAALKNPSRKCKTLYTTKTISDELQATLPNLKLNIQIMDSAALTKLAPKDTNHQNIILEADPLKQLDIEDLVEITSSKESSCVMILDQVTDPHNVGAILRSAAAFSADAVILPHHNSPKENNTIIKCSAGASETVPMIYVNNLVNCIKTLKQEGYWIIGLDGHTNNILGPNIFSHKIAFILGSEDTGIRKLVKENCDYIAKINISSNLESLNVSNAAVIALYEFSKYRN